MLDDGGQQFQIFHRRKRSLQKSMGNNLSRAKSLQSTEKMRRAYTAVFDANVNENVPIQ